MTAFLSTWAIEFDAGQAIITHDRGRIVERLKLTADFSSELRKLGPEQLTAGLLRALWGQAEAAPADLIAERQVQCVSVH